MYDPDYSSSALALIINHLWQATFFATIVSVVALLLRKAPARLRYALWIVASLKFVIPSALLISVAGFLGFDASSLLLSMAWATGDPVWLVDRQHHLFFLAGSETGFANANFLLKLISVVWLSGTVAILSVWLRRQILFYREIQRGTLLDSGREYEILRRTTERLPMQTPVRLIVSPKVTEPGVWGIRHPIILFPENMAETLGDSELETVFLHELAHIKRWDNLISSLQMMISSLFWFHPLVWWIDRQMLSERERACDDRVIEYGGHSREYARGLVKVLQFGLGFRMAGVSCASGSNLKTRIEHIVSGSGRTSLSLRHRVILAGIVTGALCLSIAAVQLSECDRLILRQRAAAYVEDCSKKPQEGKINTADKKNEPNPVTPGSYCPTKKT